MCCVQPETTHIQIKKNSRRDSGPKNKERSVERWDNVQIQSCTVVFACFEQKRKEKETLVWPNSDVNVQLYKDDMHA